MLLATGKRWLQSIGHGLRARSSETYWAALRALRDGVGDRPLCLITREVLQRWFVRRLKTHALATVRSERTILALFFGWCVAQHELEDNPIRGTVLPKLHRQRPMIPTAQEVAVYLAELPEPVRSVVELASETGLRRRTLLELEWADVTRRDGVAWLSISGEKLKSHRDLEIPLSRKAEAVLDRMRNGDGGKVTHLPASTLTYHWKRAVRKHGRDYRFHSLRKFFLTECRRRGVQLEVAMRLSDHNDIQTVLECYRAVDPEELVQAVR